MATRKTPSRKAAEPPLPNPAEASQEFPSEKAEAVIEANVEPVEMSEESLPGHAAEESANPSPAPKATGTGAALEATAHEYQPRFHFFIIDSGWKSISARVIRENFDMIREFQNNDPLYILTRDQSIKMIRENPDLIGKDPLILVHDLHAKGGRGEDGYHGFRLCLGLIKKSEQALFAMQEFLRFVHNHRHSANIEKDIKERLHRKGLEGAIEVLRDGAQEAMG